MRDGEAAAFLHPLPVGRLWGVGAGTEKTLAALSLRTIGDVARAGESVLALRLGADRRGTWPSWPAGSTIRAR